MFSGHKPIGDQVIVITGATSGIGLTTAREAAAKPENKAKIERLRSRLMGGGSSPR